LQGLFEKILKNLLLPAFLSDYKSTTDWLIFLLPIREEFGFKSAKRAKKSNHITHIPLSCFANQQNASFLKDVWNPLTCLYRSAILYIAVRCIVLKGR